MIGLYPGSFDPITLGHEDIINRAVKICNKLVVAVSQDNQKSAFLSSEQRINLIKSIGVLIGFSGIVYLFSDNILINKNNFVSALLILSGSTFYVIGGLLTLKISNKKMRTLLRLF